MRNKEYSTREIDRMLGNNANSIIASAFSDYTDEELPEEVVYIIENLAPEIKQAIDFMIEDANRNVRKWRKQKFKTQINIDSGMDIDLNTPMRDAFENAMYEHDGISDVSANRVMYHIYDSQCQY